MPSASEDAGTMAPPTAGSGGGGAPPPIAVVNGCPDLDTNGLADCQETEITNPNFARDVTGWLADANASLTWAADDALSDQASGSALVAAPDTTDSPGTSLFSASQCVTAGSKELVIVYANAFVDEGQDAAGGASLYVSFFDAADCTGTSNAGFNTPTPLDASAGSWFTVQAGSLTGTATRSALVKLAITKPASAATFRARFDNVLFKQHAPQ